MIWVGVAVLAIIAIGPAALALRRGVGMRGRREPAIALHRAQLAEIDRDLADGRIGPTEHATARLEVQRRLLADADSGDDAPRTGGRGLIAVSLVIVPLAAVGLYLYGGSPELPATPLAERIAAAQQAASMRPQMIAKIRADLPNLEPGSNRAYIARVILGNLEAEENDFAAAAEDWRGALAIRFEPTLAVQVAEAALRAEGGLSPASVELLRRAVRDSALDGQWRALAEQRLAQAGAPAVLPGPRAARP